MRLRVLLALAAAYNFALAATVSPWPLTQYLAGLACMVLALRSR